MLYFNDVLFSVGSLQDRCHFVLNLYGFLLFVPGTNKIKRLVAGGATNNILF